MSRSVSLDAPQRLALLVALALMLSAMLGMPQMAAAEGPPDAVRFATFNASLNRLAQGVALADFLQPFDPDEPDPLQRMRRWQAANVAQVIQRTRPEVLLIGASGRRA
jgi:hypothetical protein